MMFFACLVVVSLMMCNDFSRQGRLVAWRGRGLRGSVSEVWTAGHGGVNGWGRGRGRYLSDLCVFCSSVFSVRKNMSFFICHYVILSSKKHLLSFSLCHYVGHQRIQNLDKTVQKNRKEGVSIMTHPLLLCYYLEEEISSQRPFYFFLPFVMYFIATFISLAITFASRWRSSLSFPCK